jgi:hypothetical protein
MFSFNEGINSLKKIRMILGVSFIILAFGILFNYLIYFFIWAFEHFDGFLLISLKLIENIVVENINLDLTIFYSIVKPLFGLASFISITQFFIALCFFINSKIALGRPKRPIMYMISSIIGILIFGFECLPYLL